MADVGYWNDDGIKMALDAATGKSATTLNGAICRLFTTNIVVDKTTTFAMLTQATFNGYAGIALVGATWGAATVAVNIAGSGYTATLVFTKAAGGAVQTMYGAYLTDAANTKLYNCWNFASGPWTLTNTGETISVTPSLSMRSLL